VLSLNKQDAGFIILESLVSLSILAFFVGIVIPFSMEMLLLRSQKKEQVEASRFLYESALFYDASQPKDKTYHSGGVSAHSIETEKSIHIYIDNERITKMDYISAEWNINEK
ncbi:MAG: hypothetical protein ACTH80_01885, partial [Alkalibacterium gilvum]